MFKKIMFLLILFIMPLFANSAFAAEIGKGSCYSLSLQVGSETAVTFFTNGTSWYRTSSDCTSNGRASELSIPTRSSDGAKPMYFKGKCSGSLTIINANSSDKSATYTSNDIPCTFSNGTYTCNFSASNITSNVSYCSETLAVPTNLTSISFNALTKKVTASYSTSGSSTTTISFNVNGGSGGQSSTVKATYGSSMPSISTTAPTRTGYTFMGWYDNATYTSGTQYYTAAGASARTWNKTTSTATLYAGWNAKCNKITLSANGGTNGSPTTLYKKTGSATWYTNSTCTTSITKLASIASKTDSTFTGYYTGSTSGTQCITSDGTLSAISSCNFSANQTLYAQYQQTSTCYKITLKFQTKNQTNSDVETKLVYHNGVSWCSDNRCEDCGISETDLFSRSDGMYPAYFSNAGTLGAYKEISSGGITTISDTNTITKCQYNDETGLSCSLPTTGGTWWAYVFVAPRLSGAYSGGALKSFSNNNTSSKSITVSYYSATCSDATTVHFYGIKTDGTFGSVGTAKFYYDDATWGNSSGTIKTNFSGLAIPNSFRTSVNVNGITYKTGLTAYRAAWVGGEPSSCPSDIVSINTTGIIDPSERPYDIFVTGTTLPNIRPELFSDSIEGSAKNVYYVLLYAANCINDSTTSHATCNLTITNNGGAVYYNQCLSGFEIDNMGNDVLLNAPVASVAVRIDNECAI